MHLRVRSSSFYSSGWARNPETQQANTKGTTLMLAQTPPGTHRRAQYTVWYCYGLNIWIPLKFICWNFNLQCDGNRKWSHWEVISCEGAPLMNEISALWKRVGRVFLLCLSCEVRARNWTPMNQEDVYEPGSNQTLDMPAPWSWTSQSSDYEKKKFL